MSVRKIEMLKYGKFLRNREEGGLAYRKLRDEVQASTVDDIFVFNFTGVYVMAPSYADEVFGNLQEKFPDKIFIEAHTDHAFKVSLETVEETRALKFQYR